MDVTYLLMSAFNKRILLVFLKCLSEFIKLSLGPSIWYNFGEAAQQAQTLGVTQNVSLCGYVGLRAT